MSIVLPAPPTIITCTRSSYKDDNEPHLAVFNGTNPEVNNNRHMAITWDRFRTILTPESLKLMNERIMQHDRVEVHGKWTIYVNPKTQKPTIGMMLEHINREDPTKARAVQDVDIPTEKRFTYEETEDSLTLQKYTHIHEIKKIDRKAEERAKIVKSRKVATVVDYSDSEHEDPTDRGSGGPPSGGPPGGGSSRGGSSGGGSSGGGSSGGGSSGGGSSGGGSSGGGPPSSRSGGPPSSTKPGATKPGPGKGGFSGTHQRFGGDDVDMS